MTTNVGTIDRILRAALGVVLLYLAFFKYGAAVIGVVMLATSTLKLCPLYSIFGIKTCKDC